MLRNRGKNRQSKASGRTPSTAHTLRTYCITYLKECKPYIILLKRNEALVFEEAATHILILIVANRKQWHNKKAKQTPTVQHFSVDLLLLLVCKRDVAEGV